MQAKNRTQSEYGLILAIFLFDIVFNDVFEAVAGLLRKVGNEEDSLFMSLFLREFKKPVKEGIDLAEAGEYLVNDAFALRSEHNAVAEVLIDIS